MFGLFGMEDGLNKRRSQQAPWHAHKTSPSGEMLKQVQHDEGLNDRR